ncbi:Uncharacterized protein GBIM_16853, partial [Gryllus bimaculatus]
MDNPVDTRLEYVGKYVTKSLRLKPDKWGRLLAVDEQRDQVLEFLNRPDLTVMLVLQNTAATLTIVTGFPASIKSKAVYFIKKNAQAVTKDNMEDLLIPGDIAPKAIEHLACLVEEVFVPILSNPDNHTTWPAAVAQDIHMHVHGLKSTVYQVKGQVTGQTVLAMPVGVERIVDLYLKSAIEGVIIKWATQINDVITEDSAQAFANGNNPVPYEEVAFWDARLRNLRYIYQQLRDERVRKMAVILEKTDSAYFPCFKTLFRNIAKKYLDPSSIFQSDVMEAKERIKDVVTTLTMFRKVFDNRREKIATYFEDREPVLWNFHPNMVFERFNAFLARLATIELIEIVGTVLDRPLIEREFTAKYAQVLDRLDQDVAVSEELYEEQMREYSRSGSMPVDVHMPPVAGAMRWARMLARRDAFSVQRFRELNH